MAFESRILFVDDEPFVLRALQRGLRRQRERWEMVFANGSREALDELGRAPADVIVSDVTMPKPDGVALLGEVRERFPDTVRVMMSGTSEGAVSMRAVPVAHQFLSKPYDINQLIKVVERAIELRRMLTNENVRAVIGRLSSLPAMPRVFQALCRVVEDPEAHLGDVVDVVATDPAIAGRVLQIVNSAFFAPARRVSSIEEAVRHLGTSMLKNLVLAIEAFTLVDEVSLPIGFSMSAAQDHAIRCGMLASTILRDVDPGAAYTAGLLHDVGRLILASRLPDETASILAEAKARRVAPRVIEQVRLGVTHAEIGAYLLGIWGLTHDVVCAVMLHHRPDEIEQLDVSAAVHIANGLIDEATGKGDTLDGSLIERLGVAGRVPEWRKAMTSLKRA